MPKIHFAKNHAPVSVEEGANLMQELLRAGLPVASSCHGDGICGKCRIVILEGKDHLSPPNTTEMILCQRLKVPSECRISCQTKVFSDVKVDTSYW